LVRVLGVRRGRYPAKSETDGFFPVIAGLIGGDLPENLSDRCLLYFKL
jgi:hypothetical protein